MGDTFLKEQLELLRELNERVDKIFAQVHQNVNLVTQTNIDEERRAREQRVYRGRQDTPRAKTSVDERPRRTRRVREGDGAIRLGGKRHHR